MPKKTSLNLIKKNFNKIYEILSVNLISNMNKNAGEIDYEQINLLIKISQTLLKIIETENKFSNNDCKTNNSASLEASDAEFLKNYLNNL